MESHNTRRNSLQTPLSDTLESAIAGGYVLLLLVVIIPSWLLGRHLTMGHLLTFLQRLLANTADALAVGDALLPGLLAQPMGPWALGFIVAGAAGSAAYEVYQNHAQSKKLDELAAYVEHLLKNQLGAVKRAAEHMRFDLNGNLDLSQLSQHEQQNPYLIFYKLITTRFSQAESRQQAIISSLKQNQELSRTLTAFLIRHADRVAKELELSQNELRELQAACVQTASQLDQIAANTRHCPPLRVPLISDTARYRFVYGARHVPFFGREAELAALNAFLDDAKDFHWWLWTGPGGFGKSRLALEFVLEAQWRGWDAGFLCRPRVQESDFNEWDRWQLERPTLVVVDYVAERARQIGKAIEILHHRAESERLGPRLRFLLLERHADKDDPWLRDLYIEESAPAKAVIEGRRYRESYPLKPMTDDGIWQVLEHILRERNYPLPDAPAQLHSTRTAILDVFNQAFNHPGQEHRRPMFAALAAEAIAEQGLDAIRRWSIENLVEHVLRRETANWRNAGIQDNHASALLLATLTGGVSRTRVYELAECSLKGILPAKRDFDASHYRMLCGFSAEIIDGRLAPLEPDILGECFTLERLNGNLGFNCQNPDVIREDAEAILDAAWQEAPQATAEFISRAAPDFPFHKSISALCSPRRRSHEERFWWCSLAGYLMGVFDRAGDADRVSSLFRELQEAAYDSSLQKVLVFGYLHHAEINRRAGRLKDAIADFTAVIETLNVDADQRAWALIGRSAVNKEAGQIEHAIADCTLAAGIQGTSPDRKAEALANRGAIYLEIGQVEPAIADCTEAIGLTGIHASRRAAALFNRGLAYMKGGQRKEALADLTSVVEMPGALTEHKAMAQFYRAEVYEQNGDKERALADLTQLIEMPNAPAEQQVFALRNLAIVHAKSAQPHKSIEELTRAVGIAGLPVDAKAYILNTRALMFARVGHFDKMLHDFTEVIGLLGVSVGPKARALMYRGQLQVTACQFEKAAEDFTSVVQMANLPAVLLMQVLCLRATTYMRMNRVEKAISDYSEVIGIPNSQDKSRAFDSIGHIVNSDDSLQLSDELVRSPLSIILEPPHKLRLRAHLDRGIAYIHISLLEKAIADFAAVIDFPGIPMDMKAHALVGRGAAWGRSGRWNHAIADATAVLSMSDATADQKLDALHNRSVAYGATSQLKAAVADCTTLVGLPDAPADKKAQALASCGVARLRRGEGNKAIADLTTAVEMPGISNATKARMVFTRGAAYQQLGWFGKARQDFSSIMSMPDVPAEVLRLVLLSASAS